MALVSQCKCEHPKIIRNKYTGEECFVSCKRCVSCQRARQSVWVAKLQQEAKCHLYTYEVELDYNKRFLPKYDFSKSGDALIEVTKRLKNYYRKFPDQKKIYFKDLKFDTDADRNYFIERLNTHNSCIPHASVYDVQLFKKRLNTLIKREVTGKYQNFRSAFVSELGSTTIRPHMHGIIYFDDERLTQKAYYSDGNPVILLDKHRKPYHATRIQNLVFRAWRSTDNRPLGHAETWPDRGKFASYLAKYICLPSDIPSFYAHTALRPFFLTSRKPALGSLYESSAQVRFIFDNASPKRVDFIKQGEFWVPKVLPISQTIENRLFPKCYAYGKISNFDRAELYRCAVINDDVPSFNKWIDHLFNRIFDSVQKPYSYIYSYRSVPIYDFDTYQNYIKGYFIGDYVLKDTHFAHLVYSLSREFEGRRFFENVYTVSKRVWMQSKILGVPLENYINKILLYHNYNKPQFLLQRFYDIQNQVNFNFKDYDYRYFYPLSFMRDGFSPNDAPDAKQYFDSQHFKYKEEKKTKFKNDYFESLKVKDHPLYVLLQNYYHAKKCNENDEAIT